MLNDGSQFMGSDTRHAVSLAGGDRVWQEATLIQTRFDRARFPIAQQIPLHYIATIGNLLQ